MTVAYHVEADDGAGRATSRTAEPPLSGPPRLCSPARKITVCQPPPGFATSLRNKASLSRSQAARTSLGPQEALRPHPSPPQFSHQGWFAYR
jgi:hypothetical protein